MTRTSGVIAAAAALLLFGVCASAAPPGGAGGGGMGRSMGATPGGSPGRPDSATQPGIERSTHDTTDAASQGRTVDEILASNTKLASQIKTLTGQSAPTACVGFKNVGDCVSAAHVSKNLSVSFDDLRSRMTGSSPESLGQAIHALKPDADAKAEARKAGGQAKEDLKGSG